MFPLLFLSGPLFFFPLVGRLPDGAVTMAIRTDEASNVYVAGYLGSQTNPQAWDAFVAKYNASQVDAPPTYLVMLKGALLDRARSLAVDDQGYAYVTGDTS